MKSPTIWDRCEFNKTDAEVQVPTNYHRWTEGPVVSSRRRIDERPKVSKPMGVSGFFLTSIASLVLLISGGIGILFMTGVYVGSIWFLLTTGGAATLAVFVIIALLL